MIKLKYYTIKILKFFRHTVNLIGIDIHFVKKEDDFDSIEHNARESQNQLFKDPRYQEGLYHPERLKFYKDVVEKIKANTISLDNKTVADVGCGNGNLLVYVKKNFSPSQIHGYDFAGSALSQAKGNLPEGKFNDHDIYNPLPQKYDLLLCTEVLEHLLNPEIALKNLIEGINETGTLLITVPNGRIDTFKGHINFWSVESWKMFIQKNTPQNLYFETGEFNKKIVYAIIRHK
ncbi:MAG TPA: class I SAM-dependent methyltransferase [Bacteroidia bacterium]|jgi:2-polyprenyl-3-methyl-5-hydroxy-6-metoxy-1,4-benzoquinol methylase|nr:class I SAM-dependent methyltransferase [Bacteroidia bacterium]